MKRTVSVIVLVALLFSFSACGSEVISSKENFIFNGCPLSFSSVCCDELLVGLGSENATVFNTETNEKYDFIRDPFYNSKKDGTAQCVFTDGSNIYYLLDKHNEYKVIAQNPITHKESVIYKKRLYKMQKDILLGAVKTSASTADIIMTSNSPSAFVVVGDCLVLFTGDRVTSVNLKTGRENVILNEGHYLSNISCRGTKVYMISNTLNLLCYDTLSGEIAKLPDVKARLLLIAPDGVYYVTVSRELYRVGFDFSNPEKISETNGVVLEYCKGFIIASRSGDSIEIINTESGEKQIKSAPNINDGIVYSEKSDVLFRRIMSDGKCDFERLDVV